MRGYTGHFSKFYNEVFKEIIRFPKAKALWVREMVMLYSGFKAYLESKYISHRGLSLRMFERLLNEKGHIVVTNKK